MQFHQYHAVQKQEIYQIGLGIYGFRGNIGIFWRKLVKTGDQKRSYNNLDHILFFSLIDGHVET